MPSSSDLLGLAALTARYKPRLQLAATFAALTALSSLAPLVVLDQLFHALSTPQATRTALLLLPAIVLPFLCQGGTSIFCHRLAFDIVGDLRNAILKLTQHLPPFYVSRHAATLKKLTTDDSTEFETALAHTLPDTVTSLVTVLVSLVFLAVISPLMALASIGLLPIAAWAWRRIGRVASGNGRAWYLADLAINQNIMTCLAGLTTLKVFNRPPSSLSPLTRALQDIAHLACGMTRRSRVAYVMLFTCVGTNLLLVLPCALILQATHRLSLPDALFTVLLGVGLMTPLQRLMFVASTLPRLQATLKRLKDLQAEGVEQTPRQHTAPLSCQPPTDTQYDVVFENVTLERSDRGDILSGFSLTCPAGQVTGIVGPSGAGKSTVLQLAAGNLKPTTGRVLIGGIDLSTLCPHSMGRLVCPVFQQPFLLGHSLADNLRLSRPDLTAGEITDVLEACDLTPCIERFGLDGSAGRNGAYLSGGERQRLAIARVLISKAPVILLDEPTAFIDPEREFHIQQALARALKGRTVLIVAHRLVTVRDASRIAVMEHGRVTSLGHHEDLLKNSPLYQTYAQHQFADGAMP